MELSISPERQLADEAPTAVVAGGPADAGLRIELRTTDAADHRWASHGDFRTDAEGALAVELGDLLWQMEFVDEEVAPTAFAGPADRLHYDLEAICDGECASAVQERVWRADGIDAEPVRGEGFVGTMLSAAGPGPARSAVLIVPSSTGLAAVEPQAGLLASRGHDVLIAAYMGEEGLPASLCEIPLEVFGAAMAALRARSDAAHFSLLAASVSTQGALAALAHGVLDADRAAMIAPSSVVWQALAGEAGRPPSTSAWTLAGEPMPWVPIAGERILPELIGARIAEKFTRHPRPSALHMLKAYVPGLRKEESVAAATIAVEEINCPLLLMAGEDDQMWPAAEMATAIADRRAQAGRDDEDRLLLFEGAGHFLRPPISPTTVAWNDALFSGGTASANAAAQREGWVALREFLDG